MIKTYGSLKNRTKKKEITIFSDSDTEDDNEIESESIDKKVAKDEKSTKPKLQRKVRKTERKKNAKKAKVQSRSSETATSEKDAWDYLFNSIPNESDNKGDKLNLSSQIDISIFESQDQDGNSESDKEANNLESNFSFHVQDVRHNLLRNEETLCLFKNVEVIGNDKNIKDTEQNESEKITLNVSQKVYGDQRSFLCGDDSSSFVQLRNTEEDTEESEFPATRDVVDLKHQGKKRLHQEEVGYCLMGINEIFNDSKIDMDTILSTIQIWENISNHKWIDEYETIVNKLYTVWCKFIQKRETRSFENMLTESCYVIILFVLLMNGKPIEFRFFHLLCNSQLEPSLKLIEGISANKYLSRSNFGIINKFFNDLEKILSPHLMVKELIVSFKTHEAIEYLIKNGLCMAPAIEVITRILKEKPELVLHIEDELLLNILTTLKNEVDGITVMEFLVIVSTHRPKFVAENIIILMKIAKRTFSKFTPDEHADYFAAMLLYFAYTLNIIDIRPEAVDKSTIFKLESKLPQPGEELANNLNVYFALIILQLTSEQISEDKEINYNKYRKILASFGNEIGGGAIQRKIETYTKNFK